MIGNEIRPMALERQELRAELRSLAEFQALATARPECFDRARIDAIVAHGLAHGVQSRFLGFVPPGQVASPDGNHRESFLAAGFNARQRCVLDLIAELWPGEALGRARIHMHEAVTPLALALRGRCPYALGSEYLPTNAARADRYPVPHVDVMASGLPDAAFDLVVTNEVLEHVPDLDAALRDMARILRPGGRVVGTFPFAYGQTEGLRKARLGADDAIEHLMPPEYHGNPVDPGGGSLVFEVPGWDVIERARDAGFSDAMMVFDSSMERGITASELSGILAFVAVR
jgi:SAM-dependent methyltransferase